jgi:hypothetical protein
MKFSSLQWMLIVTLLLPSGAAYSKSHKKGSAYITEGFSGSPGVASSAAEFVSPSSSLSSVSSSEHRSSDGSVLVGIKPHSCTPIYSDGGQAGSGIGLDFVFSDTTGDCLAFSSLPDAPPIDRERSPDYSPGDLAAIAADKARSLATLPALRAAPSKIGLTGLPTYVWLPRRPATVSATAEVPGLSVTAEAYPVRYIWDFGDGGIVETGSHGSAWTERGAGSIRHIYQRKGAYTLSVRVVWYARWRVGRGPWRPLGHFMNSATRDHPVREVVSVLRRSPR